MNLAFRQATLQDAKALSDLICENAATLLRPHYSDEQLATFCRYYSVAIMQEKLQRQVVFCACLGEEIVGTAALDGDLVVGFYTKLSHVNKGIGRQIMEYLEDYALNAGLTALQLTASPVGVAFYLKNGWQRVHDCIFEYLGVGFEEVLMRKDLTKNL